MIWTSVIYTYIVENYLCQEVTHKNTCTLQKVISRVHVTPKPRPTHNCQKKKKKKKENVVSPIPILSGKGHFGISVLFPLIITSTFKEVQSPNNNQVQ